MKACVTLPDYGSNLRAWAKQRGQMPLARKSCPRPWIARRTRIGLEFVKGFTDYGQSNGDGTRGVLVRFYCDVGDEYLVSESLPAGGARRFLARVKADGTLETTPRV